MTCADCGRELERDEHALSYKLIGRGARQLYCMDCLGRRFRLSREALEGLIVRFREAGCTLFT